MADVSKQIKQQQKSTSPPPSESSTPSADASKIFAQTIDDVDQAPIMKTPTKTNITTWLSSFKKSPGEDRRMSMCYLNGLPLGGNSLISRDALILAPEGGKNSATGNGERFPTIRSASDDESSDTEVSTHTHTHINLIGSSSIAWTYLPFYLCHIGRAHIRFRFGKLFRLCESRR